MHLAPLIRDLSVILGAAGIVTLLFERIKQPVVLGYLVAGMLIGPYTPPVPLITDLPVIKVWAELGVIFLMFSLGLEFSFRKLTQVGISAGITAILEVIIMLLLGYQTGKLLGWEFNDRLFLGAMLSISSTTIIIKTFDELGLKTKRFAELVFGILIVEDLVAILLLVGLSTIAVNNNFSLWVLAASAGKLIFVVGSWFILGYFLVPRFVRLVGQTGSSEMLTILSISLCLGLVVLSAFFHYSVALGAFIMGSILAETTEAHRIEQLIQPLRDMFAAVFFVSVGMLIDPKMLLDHFWPVVIITIATIIGKIFSTTLGCILTGQTVKSSLKAGFSLAQIGEFSFIIATLGSTLNVTHDFLYPIAVAVSVLTTFATPYLLKCSDKCSQFIESKLPLQMNQFLNWYSAWVQGQSANTVQSSALYRLAFRWAVDGLIVTLIFLLVFDTVDYLTKIYSPNWLSAAWVPIISYVIAIFFSSTFLWRMSTRFDEFTQATSVKGLLENPKSLLSFAARLCTILWLDLLSLRFFDGKIALLLTLLSVVGFSVFFYQKLESTYRWFEQSFLSTFREKEAKEMKANASVHIPSLAPWDAHLVRLTVHPNAEVAGNSLQSLNLRTKYGVNILAVQRELETIVAPGSTSVIFPRDELLLLGTDEQIEELRNKIEEPSSLLQKGKDITEYQLRNFLIPANSLLCNKTIRQTNIRERFSLIVVGLEREQKRTLNPDSNLTLRTEDILWVVAEIDKLDALESFLNETVHLQT